MDAHLIRWGNCSISSLTSNTRANDSNGPFTVAIWIECVLMAGHTYLRDNVEKKFTELFVDKNIDIWIQGYGPIKCIPYFVFDDIKTFIHHSDVKSFLRINGTLEPSSTAKFHAEMEDIIDLVPFINITKLLTCSHIEFNESDYTIDFEGASLKMKITLNLTGRQLTFADSQDLNEMVVNEENFLYVCKDLLEKKLRGKHKANLPSRLLTVQYILTLSCIGASLLCLVLTLMTYFMFPIMQNEPGKNTMFLCLSLMMAQISLIVSSNISSTGLTCQFVGVFTHFSWLWMFVWSFICSFNMFRVFTSKTRNSVARDEEKLKPLKRFVVSLLMPVSVVLVVVVTTLIMTEGESIGYGDHQCYLDSPVTVGLTVLGPLTLIVGCNVVFFTLTVVNIERILHLQHNNCSDKRNLLVYLKLSSLTGAFWTMAVVGEATDLDVLKFVSICLNGLQGVFIFLSFICNKKIMKLYTMALTTRDRDSRVD